MDVVHIFGSGSRTVEGVVEPGCEHFPVGASSLQEAYTNEHGALPTKCLINKCPNRIHRKKALTKLKEEGKATAEDRVCHMAHVFKCDDIFPATYIIPTCDTCNIGKNGQRATARLNARIVALPDCNCWMKDFEALKDNLSSPANWGF